MMKTSFNSRTREGCDIAAADAKANLAEFQFTHPRGVRLRDELLVLIGEEFQFTHPRGVRRRVDLPMP